jgi:hypothetical protein
MRACKGSKLVPSPRATKDRVFWFLMDLTSPVTVTFFSTAGESSNLDTENEVGGATDVWVYLFLLLASNWKDLRRQRSAIVVFY